MANAADDQDRLRHGDQTQFNDFTTAPVDTVQYRRPISETIMQNGPQVINVPRDGVRWGPIWAGLFATLTTLLFLSLIGLAVGLTTVNAGAAAATGSVPSDLGRNAGIMEAIFVIVAYLVGGFVAGRAATVYRRGWGALNGAMVFLLSVPFILALASIGFGTLLASLGHSAAGLTITIAPGGGASGAAQVADAVRATAWGGVIAIVIGLLASAIGGAIGTRRRPAGQWAQYTSD